MHAYDRYIWSGGARVVWFQRRVVWVRVTLRHTPVASRRELWVRRAPATSGERALMSCIGAAASTGPRLSMAGSLVKPPLPLVQLPPALLLPAMQAPCPRPWETPTPAAPHLAHLGAVALQQAAPPMHICPSGAYIPPRTLGACSGRDQPLPSQAAGPAGGRTLQAGKLDCVVRCRLLSGRLAERPLRIGSKLVASCMLIQTTARDLQPSTQDRPPAPLLCGAAPLACCPLMLWSRTAPPNRSIFDLRGQRITSCNGAQSYGHSDICARAVSDAPTLRSKCPVKERNALCRATQVQRLREFRVQVKCGCSGPVARGIRAAEAVAEVAQRGD